MKNKWQNYLNGDPIPWLLDSNPWTRYRTLLDILESPEDSDEAEEAFSELVSHPQIQNLIKEASRWFPQSITRHNIPTLSHYGFAMLAEFGLTVQHPGIRKLAEKAAGHLENGLFAVRQTLPEKGDGFGKADPEAGEWHAMPCDSPLISYALLLTGYQDDRLIKSVDLIKNQWETKQGWFCHFFFVEGMYNKLQIGCPMAGLMALQVFSRISELKESEFARNACAPVKFHKDSGKSLYYFGRSKKFWTLKYPFVWYNALYLADVLTRFSFLKKDPLVRELVEWIESSQDENGLFRPTSMFMPYKGWDFANKKEPSPWITFLCCRILKQWYE